MGTLQIKGRQSPPCGSNPARKVWTKISIKLKIGGVYLKTMLNKLLKVVFPPCAFADMTS